jgi:hypothetical protein
MGILASAKPGSHCKANRLDLTPFQLARFCCSAERACGALEGARLRGKLDHRLAQCLRAGDALRKRQAQRGVAKCEVEAVGVEIDQRDVFSSVITYVNSWGPGWGDQGRFRMRLRTYEKLDSVDLKQFTLA